MLSFLMGIRPPLLALDRDHYLLNVYVTVLSTCYYYAVPRYHALLWCGA